MSKKKDKTSGKAANGAAGNAGGAKIPKEIAGFKLPKDLRRKGEALIAQAKSPAGQAVIAKGLTMAAGLASMVAARSAEGAAARSARAGGQAGPQAGAKAGVAPKAAESAEGVGGPAPGPAYAPLDPAKIAETVSTVADAVLGRFFPKR